MEPNPYKPPAPPNFKDDQPQAKDATAEIRDILREMLDLQRQAVLRQKKLVRAWGVLVVVLLPILAMALAVVLYAVNSLQYLPAAPASRQPLLP